MALSGWPDPERCTTFSPWRQEDEDYEQSTMSGKLPFGVCRSKSVFRWRPAKRVSSHNDRAQSNNLELNRAHETESACPTSDDHTPLVDFNVRAMMQHQQGQLSEAIITLQQGLPLLQEVLGTFHPETLSLMSNLGAMLIESQRLKEAEPLCLEVLERRLAVIGREDLSTIKARTNLATLYKAQGNLQYAASQWQQVS